MVPCRGQQSEKPCFFLCYERLAHWMEKGCPVCLRADDRQQIVQMVRCFHDTSDFKGLSDAKRHCWLPTGFGDPHPRSP